MSTNNKFTKLDKPIPVAEIGNALTSISDDHILGTAGDIYDTGFHNGAYQSEINRYLDNNFSSYLPLTGGVIKGTLEINDDNNNALIALGTKYDGIKIGSDAGIKISNSEISIGTDDGLKIGNRGINIGSGTSTEIKIGIGSGFSGIQIGSGLKLGTGEISLDTGEINIGSGTSNEIKISNGEISIGSNSAARITISSSNGILFEDKDTKESNAFNIYGVKYPLTVLYRDVDNNPVEFDYKASKPVAGDRNFDELGNNLNTIDLSRGVYYATTAKTATRVSNELTIQTADGEVKYNGQTKENINLANLIEITYDELVSLRDNSQLFPGQQYRIIDYETHISSVGTSAKHKFDVIVTALSCDTLSEDAKACHAKIPGGSDENTNNINFSYNVSKPYAGHIFNASDWLNVAVDDIPSGIIDILSFTPTDSTHVRYRTIDTYNGKPIYCNKGIIKVLWNWDTGSKKINILGVDLLSEDNTVVSHDYHVGSTGTSQVKNIYSLIVPESGNYKLVYYIDGLSEEVNSTCIIYAFEAFEKYFANNKLSAWELKYSLDNTSNRFGWPSSNGKGHIYYMKDEFGNECSFDFKNVKYENGTYYTFDYEINGIHFDGSVKYGNLCYDNKIPLDISGANGKLDLPKIYFKNTTETSQCHTNKLSHDSWNITFGDSCYGNSVGEKSENISFGDDCFHNILKCSNKNNTFGNYCSSNELGVGCTGNTFGDKSSTKAEEGCIGNAFGEGCIGNAFGEGCTGNAFGEGCIGNAFGEGCTGNKFSNKCTDNKFGDSCCNNVFGNNCTGNNFGVQCNNNTFGNECTGNKFGDECFLNTFKDKLSGNTFGTGFYSNVMGENCKNNKFGNSCYCNEFGDYCWNIELGNLNTMNKFGHLCEKIYFRSSSSSTTAMAYVNNVEVGASCYNITIYPKDVSISPTSQKLFKYYRIGPEIKNTTIKVEGTADSIVNRKYWTNIEKNSAGTIIQKCLMDIDKCFKTSYSNGKLTISSM